MFIVIVGIVIYANALHTPFQFDDKAFILNNPSIRSLTNPSAIWDLLSQPSRFIGFYSFALNYHFVKTSVFGYHLTNLVIHILTAICVFFFIEQIFVFKESKKSTLPVTPQWIALCGALIFVAHPIQTQAVTYISQRFASLATFFYISSLFCYLKARMHSHFKVSIAWFLLSGLLGMLGMFTKEIVITLPIMIGLTEFYLQKTHLRISFKPKVFFSLIAILISFFVIIPAIFSFSLKGVLLGQRISESHDGDILTLGPYLLTQIRVAVKFLQLLIFPVGQNLDYDFPASFNFWDSSVILNLSILLSLLAFSIYIYRHSKILSYGIFWFFVTFSANLIPRRHVIFEHKVYLLSIGFCIFISVVLAELVKTQKQYVFISTCLIIILSIGTIQRNKVWETEITLWSDVVKKSPDKQRPYINLGSAYLAQKEYDLSIKHLTIALDMNKSHAKGYLNRGVALAANKDYLQALKDYSQAIKIEPNFMQAFVNRGIVLFFLGDRSSALEDFNQAIFLDPKFSESYFNRGNLYKADGKIDLAFKDFSKALTLNTKYADAYRDRGVIYLKQGQVDLAMQDLNLALKFNSSQKDYVYINIAVIQIKKKEYSSALENINNALSINPNSKIAQNNKLILMSLIKKEEE